MHVAAVAIFTRLGPALVAAAGVFCGALLSWNARSVIPAVGVIGAVGAGALAENALKDLVERAPWTAAELQSIPEDLLRVGLHSFPSGHVTGIAALLGMIAVWLRAGRSRAVRAILAGLAVACVLVIGFAAFYIGVHCGSDVIGGMVLGAACVTLGAAWLTRAHSRTIRSLTPAVSRRRVL